MHASSSGNSHHKSGNFWKASGSPTFLSHDPSLLSHSQVADDAARSVIVPAVAAGILLARETSARIAGIADGTRPPAVILAILEDEVAVFASRNRGDDGARLHSD